MARKLEDVLRAKGYSDTDLEALKTLLADSKFRGALEDDLAALESDRDKFKGEAESWSTWYQDTGLPAVDKALKDAQDANARAAGHEARIKTLQEQGLIRQANTEDDLAARAKAAADKPPEKFDPKQHNLVTMEDAHRFLDAEGDAIALASDLAAEHQALFGKPLTGLRELRKEAITAKRPIYDYVAEKLKFGERRGEIAAKAAADKEAEIRKDERTKTIAEVTNPNARPPSDSRFTLIPGSKADGKQPWENAEERSHARVSKALASILQ